MQKIAQSSKKTSNSAKKSVKKSAPSCLLLMPFLIHGSLPIRVAHELHKRGVKILLAEYMNSPAEYPAANMEQFREQGLILDLRNKPWQESSNFLVEYAAENNVRLIVQVGSPDAYFQLSQIRYHLPDVSILDWLFNPSGHTLRHFLCEPIIDGVIVESTFMSEFYKEHRRLEDTTIHVVRSGTDLSAFNFSKRKPRKRFKVGFIGRLSWEKDPLIFIEIAKKLCDHLPHVDFSIAGSGPMSKEVEAAVKKAKLGNRLKFLGFVDSMSKALSNLDAFIVPSKLDGRPAAVMEAAAVGRPVIVSDVGGLPEMVIEGKTGAVCKPSDFDGIASLLKTWSSSEALHERLRKQARAHAEANFQVSKMMDEYHSVISSYLDS